MTQIKNPTKDLKDLVQITQNLTTWSILMTNDYIKTEVFIDLNANVLSKIMQLSLLPEENVAQEAVDSIYANLLFLVTAMEPKDAGLLVGEIMVDAAQKAKIAKTLLGDIS